MMLTVLVLLSLFGLGACERQADEGAPVNLVPEAAADDEIVATVDGRPIRASDVARQAAVAKQDAKAALETLIRAEALTSEAMRRKLDRGPEVLAAARPALVYTALDRIFVPSTTA